MDKEENLLFKYKVSFELYCSIYILRYILPGLEKTGEVHSNVSLFAKSVSLFKKM